MKMNCCNHPPEKVTADILQGDWPEHAVQWCRMCGAFRVIVTRKDPAKNYVTPWTLPQEPRSEGELKAVDKFGYLMRIKHCIHPVVSMLDCFEMEREAALEKARIEVTQPGWIGLPEVIFLRRDSSIEVWGYQQLFPQQYRSGRGASSSGRNNAGFAEMLSWDAP
jgi:hypothetical protein